MGSQQHRTTQRDMARVQYKYERNLEEPSDTIFMSPLSGCRVLYPIFNSILAMTDEEDSQFIPLGTRSK